VQVIHNHELQQTNCPIINLIMKKIVSFVLSLAFAGSTFAQMSGYSSSSYSEGTALGSNETLTADGIALGNAVKLRGYIDTVFSHLDNDDNTTVNETDISASADLDILIDLSPVTAEVHLNLSDGNASNLLEQAFGRYSFNQDLHLTFGKQLTVLGFEGDEATDLYSVTSAYARGLPGRPSRSYVEGVRINYNNGLFGLVFGVHDTYGLHKNAPNLDDGMAIDLAASVMFFPGLEAQLGFANENGAGGKDDSQQINGWIAWNPGDLTLALEFDSFNFDGDDVSDIMLLANYQFSDFFGATFRYAHMEHGSNEADRITLATLFSITDNFGLNLEYSYCSSDLKAHDGNEFYVEGLISY
jgi:hypothetical protein